MNWEFIVGYIAGMAVAFLIVFINIPEDRLKCTQEYQIGGVQVTCDAPDIFKTDQKIQFVVNEMG